MSAQTKEWLRPSMLPKLALCGHYRPDAAGDAAARGTAMDAAFRELIASGQNTTGLESEELEAVAWAADTAQALAVGWPLFSDETQLKIEALGLTGTADLLCEGAGWSADLKSGQKRNYVEQQAAYALGFMELLFRDEWTVYLLYCDLREVETLRFTLSDAQSLVRGVLAKARGDEPPAVNDYCGWCVSRWTCEARKESLGIIPFVRLQSVQFEKMDSARLRDFTLRAKVVEEFSDKARELLKERCIGGEKVDGVSLASRRGTRKLPAIELAPLVAKIGAEKVLAPFADIAEAKAVALWTDSGLDFPADKVFEAPGSTSIRISHPKALK